MQGPSIIFLAAFVFSFVIGIVLVCCSAAYERRDQGPAVGGGGRVQAPVPAGAVQMASDALALLDHVTYLRMQRSAAAASAGGSAAAAAAAAADEDGGGGAICLGTFEGGEWCSVMPLCAHEFHRRCVEGWLRAYNNTCPLCRAQLQWNAVRLRHGVI
ncbi:hypothetical protein BS78_05G111700 [Paspalum vaginatum]|nr:hypothetical protein BS78_05G111700 [Paspalum vaginatum]